MAKGVSVNSPMLQEKTLHFKWEIERVNGEITASDGWLGRWKKRYGIYQLSISGEASSANKDAVPEFKKLFSILYKEGISDNQLYN